jgi:hypothetical protein
MSQETGKEGGALSPSGSAQVPIARHAPADEAAEAKRRTCSDELFPTRIFDKPPPSAVVMPEQFGRYCILRVLGEGGMGTVYLARDTELDREVALKVPRFSPEEGAADVERFLVSARAAATLAHPNLCPIYEAGQLFGIPYLTMPNLNGQSLATLLKEHQRLPPEQALALVHKLALALQAAHEKGIVHRDLNPTNILLTTDGEPILMDFGLARRQGSARLTRAGQVLGTPGYLAPEQLSGVPEEQGPGCDIFSLGVILYELLTGELPFGRATPEVLLQVMTQEVRPPSARRPGISPTLDAVCAKALNRNPQDRYRTMSELARAIRIILEAGPSAAARGTEAVPATVAAAHVLAQTKPEARSSTTVAGRRWAVMGAAGALAVVIGLAAWWLGGESPSATPSLGVVLLEIDPSDAVVSVDGQRWAVSPQDGKEPLRIELPEGRHEFEVTRNGFEPYAKPIVLQPGQTQQLRAVLALAGNPTQRFEAETLEVAAFEHCTISVQDMGRSGFRGGVWSQGKQLFVDSRGQRGSWVEWRLPVAWDRSYYLDLLATQAPDFGKLQASVDGVTVPEIIDTYGASVQPMKPLRLGIFRLAPGKHRLRLTVVGQNKASTNTCFGIDAFDLTVAR